MHRVNGNVSSQNQMQCGFLNRKTVLEVSGKKSKVSVVYKALYNYTDSCIDILFSFLYCFVRQCFTALAAVQARNSMLG